MWIKHLEIGRFGCFTDQVLEDLEPGLNVLAGPQRSGKTTFMKLLRYLGYQYPSDGYLMGPSDGRQGHLDAEVVQGDHTYGIHHRTGEPASVSTKNDAPRRSASDLYGGLSAFRYRQVFTLGLDVLRPASEASDEGRDGEAVRAALLGAGWSEAVGMPQLVRAFSQRAERVGGESGDRLGEFRSHVETIDRGEQKRREAVDELENYQELRERLSGAERRLAEAEEELDERRQQRERLRVVRDLYDDFENYRTLRDVLERDENRQLIEQYPSDGYRRAKRLYERYVEAREQFQDRLKEWKAKTREKQGRDYRRALMNHEEELERHRLTLSGLEEKVADFLDRREEFQQEYAEFQQQAAEIDEDFAKTPKKLELVRTSPGSRDKVERVTREFRKAQRRYEELQDRLSGIGYELDELKTRTDTIDRSDLIIWGGQLGGSLFFLVLAAVIGFTTGSPIVQWGSAVVALASLGFGVYSGRKAWEAWKITSAQSGLTPKVRRLRNERNELRQKKDRLKEERDEARRQLEEVREEFELPDTDPEYLRETYSELQHLKRRWVQLRPRREKLRRQEENLTENLTELIELARTLGLSSASSEDPLEEADRILGPLRDAVRHLELARQLHEVARRGDETAAEIVDLLRRERDDVDDDTLLENDKRLEEELLAFQERGERFQELQETRRELQSVRQYLTGSLDSPAVRELFEPFRAESDTDPWTLGAFASRWSEFTSAQDVQESLEELDDEVERSIERMEQTRRERRRIERKLHALSPEELLEEARLEVQEGRRGLRAVADRYARLRLAETVMERLHGRLVESLHGPLLENASDIFEGITGGDYTGIELRQHDGAVAFHARLPEGTIRSASRLSRGTREQLFLAIRLARVRTIEPPLPVILDDSAANFDPRHLRRLTRVLQELASTHQLFLLTSHPPMVHHLRDRETEGRFWSIDPDHTIVDHGSDSTGVLEPLATEGVGTS